MSFLDEQAEVYANTFKTSDTIDDTFDDERYDTWQDRLSPEMVDVVGQAFSCLIAIGVIIFAFLTAPLVEAMIVTLTILIIFFTVSAIYHKL